MINRKVTDRVILNANKIFMFIDSVKLKASIVNSCAREKNTVTEQWQVVAQSALRGGFKLASNQQNIILNSYDSIKEELSNSYKRTTELLRNSK